MRSVTDLLRCARQLGVFAYAVDVNFNASAGRVRGGIELFSKRVGPGGSGGAAAPTTGQLSVWTDADNGTVTVRMNGTQIGITSQYFNGQPSCGATGTVTATMPPGPIALTASSSKGHPCIVWNYIRRGKCNGCHSAILSIP